MKRYRTAMIMTMTALLAMLLLGIAAVQAAGGKGPDKTAPGMIGSQVNDFTLTDTEGNEHTLSAYLEEHNGVILEWFNPDCPYVKKYYAGSNPSIGEASEFAKDKGFIWLAVNSGAPGKQGHGLKRNQRAKADYGIDYPILLDEDGTVGMNFRASNTPQIYIIGEGRTVLYNGGADDTVLNTDEPQINYVINAISQLMADKDIDPAFTNHPGCTVKYAK